MTLSLSESLESELTLFETIRVEPIGFGLERLCRWPAHFCRLGRSAAALGFPMPSESTWSDWAQALQRLPEGRLRLRLDLDRSGRLSWRHAVLTELPAASVGVGLAAAPLPIEQARWVGFKTSRRSVYDQAIREAEAAGLFDLLFFNEHDELTEGARSNVLVQLDGHWFTPPQSSGLLPGVMRATLLADPGLALRERVIRRSDLPKVQAWQVCNALRGLVPATLAGLNRG